MTPPVFGYALFYNRRLPDHAGFAQKKDASASDSFVRICNAQFARTVLIWDFMTIPNPNPFGSDCILSLIAGAMQEKNADSQNFFKL
jgi:hypothetical protein